MYHYIFIARYYGGRPGEELARGLLRDKKADEYPLSLQSDEKKDKVHWTKTENLIKKSIWKISINHMPCTFKGPKLISTFQIILVKYLPIFWTGLICFG